MKRVLLAMGLLSVASGVFAAGKPCEELKSEIAAKIDANGVSGYTLEVVDNVTPDAGFQVVGSCEGGTKAIVYKR
jgi:hypothetical protein